MKEKERNLLFVILSIILIIFFFSPKFDHLTNGSLINRTNITFNSTTNSSQINMEKSLFSLADKEKGWALLKKAIDEKNLSICENMERIGAQSYFKDMCYQNMAVFFNNTSLCEKIGIEFMNFRCYMRVLGAKWNLSSCQFNYTNRWNRHTCYYHLGKISEKSLCDKLNSEGDKQSCYQGIVKRTGNISLCKGMTGDQWDSCIGAAVKATGNFSLCDKMVNETRKQRCLNNLVYTNLPFSICEGLGDEKSCLELILTNSPREKYSGLIFEH